MANEYDLDDFNIIFEDDTKEINAGGTIRDLIKYACKSFKIKDFENYELVQNNNNIAQKLLTPLNQITNKNFILRRKKISALVVSGIRIEILLKQIFSF